MFEPPIKEEIRRTMQQLKNNGSPGENGISPEMIKYRQDKTCELIVKIWEEEKNQRIGLKQLDTTYKILETLIKSKLSYHTEVSVKDYECGFRSSRSVIASKLL